jgi:hypothetical protein
MLFGARFDVAFAYLKSGKLTPPAPEEANNIVHKYDHGEL